MFLHQSPHDSKLWPLMFALLSATVVITILAASRRTLRLPQGKSLRLALAIALLDICALFTQLIAVQSWLLSLASIIISLSRRHGRAGDDRAARTGDALAGNRHGDGDGVGGHDRRQLTDRD